MRVRNLLRTAASMTALSFAAAAVPASAQDMPGKAVQITVENLTSGQPFSPSFFSTRAADGAPLFVLDQQATDQLVSVAEGGNIGGFSGQAARDMGMTIGDAALAIHTLPGQTRSTVIHVDAAHPLVDGVWMLGNTNDGFSGIAGFDAYALGAPETVELRAYDAGSEVNSEKKGFLGALGEGNMRDPENSVITMHPGIRGDADAPASWQWDVNAPVARITFTPLTIAGS